jgi:hypothetical protein
VNNDPVNWVDLWGLRPLKQEEIQHHKDSNGMPVDYSKINVEDRSPTKDDIKAGLGSVGATIPSDEEIEDFIQDRPVSMPDGNIYMPPGTRSGYGPYGTPEEEYMDVLAGEINHQAQYQSGNSKTVVDQLIIEAGMGVAQYVDQNTLEYAAHQPERDARDAALANQNPAGSQGSIKNH